MLLEKSLKDVNNKDLSLLAFVGVGAGALLAVSPVVAMFPAIGVLPFTIMALITRYRLNNNLPFAVGGEEYSKKFNRALNTYIETSENITEKKYKFLLSQIFLQHKNIKHHELRLYRNDKIDKLEDEIKYSKESSLSSNILFRDVHSSEDQSKSPKFIDFINEDANFPEKIEIAKKVYKDYQHMGFMGECFLTTAWRITEFCAALQEYKLSSKDIEYIEKLAKKDKEELNRIYGDGNFLLQSMQEMYLKIINNNKEHAPLLKTLFSKFENRNILRHIEEAQRYNEVENFYEELQADLPSATIKPVRRSKI